MERYKIVRLYADPNIGPEVVKTGVTLEEAQEWCRDPKTREAGVWFDGYDYE